MGWCVGPGRVKGGGGVILASEKEHVGIFGGRSLV